MPKVAAKDDVSAKIVKLKDTDGKTWAEISEAVDKPMGKCMFLYEQATVTPKTKISGKTEEDLKANIAKARESGLSWGVISARSGKSEGYCKTAFQEITGESPKGNRIGKGGRYPDGEGGGAKKATGAVKKATGAKKAAGAVKKATKKAAKKTAKKAGGAVKSAAVKKAVKKAAKSE